MVESLRRWLDNGGDVGEGGTGGNMNERVEG